MYSFTLFLVSLTFHLSSSYAFFAPFQGCDAGQTAALNAAISEVQNVASVAVGMLNIDPGITTDPMKAAVNPLFPQSSVGTIINYLNAVAATSTSSAAITFFCSGDFLHYSSRYGLWRDVAFLYTPQGGAEQDPAPVGLNGFTDPNTSPTTRGSFTTLGWRVANADITGQAHIYIETPRFGPSQTADRRSLSDIKANGLIQGQNHLSAIRPLSQVVLHELFHVVGGLVSPTAGTMVVNDGPSKSTYGWPACNQLKVAGLVAPETVADCLTLVTMALFLQIQSPPGVGFTYWSTGEVDINTLQPILPAASSKRQFEDLEIRRFVEKSWVA